MFTNSSDLPNLPKFLFMTNKRSFICANYLHGPFTCNPFFSFLLNGPLEKSSNVHYYDLLSFLLKCYCPSSCSEPNFMKIKVFCKIMQFCLNKSRLSQKNCVLNILTLFLYKKNVLTMIKLLMISLILLINTYQSVALSLDIMYLYKGK